jgi:hypothetical protein
MGLVNGPFDYESHRTHLGARGSYAFNIKAWIEKFGRDRVLILFQEELKSDAYSFLDSICSFIGIPTPDTDFSSLSSKIVLAARRRPRIPRLARRAREFKDWAVRHKFGRIAHIFETDNFCFNLCFANGEELAPLESAAHDKLRAILRPEIEELEALVGRDLRPWK